MSNRPFKEAEIEEIKSQTKAQFQLDDAEVNYLVFTGLSANRVYNEEESNINILTPEGEVLDVIDASDQFNTSILSRPVKKYYICYPRMV
jgi:hypothetical protein